MRISQGLRDAQTTETHYQLSIDRLDVAALGRAIHAETVRIIAERLADEFLQEHGQEVLAKMSQEAIATMAVAEAGAAVNDTLKIKHAERIVHVRESPVVYQRGIFGGIRRI